MAGEGQLLRSVQLRRHLPVSHGRQSPRRSLDARHLSVRPVLAGWYDDDEPGSTWRISLYIGDDANDAQYGSLTSIFLGRAGGTALEYFARAIGTVHDVRRARIRLSHVPRRWFIRAATFVSVSANVPVEASEPVACGIPGLDRPGQEVVADELRVNDSPLLWDLHERCGFATDFEYQGAAG